MDDGVTDVPHPLDPDRQREFALDVVRKLRAAGHQAYWAGGCVRDRLLGRTPKDYDVATDAAPPLIRELFGRKRTLAIGAAFGVITVLGPPGAGQIEVATFREDMEYRDGRRPEGVRFSTAEQDALRRDFTINGLFFDPVEDKVIDFVGGQEDLRAGVLRAIGDPFERFREDKLRMLRAVRFAATFAFRLDPATRDAIRQMAMELNVVSAERIAAEMQRVLVDRHRTTGLRLLLDTGLAETVLPEIVPRDDAGQDRLERALAVLDALEGPSFPLALAALLQFFVDREAAAAVGYRWRLSNLQVDRVAWLVEHRGQLRGAAAKRWSAVQPILAAPGGEDVVRLEEAAARAGLGDPANAAWCRAALERPRAELDPPPLLTGDDLKSQGIRPGPKYKTILDRVRDAQLDGEIQNKDDALALARRIAEAPQ